MWLIYVFIFLILYAIYRVLPPLYFWKRSKVLHVNPLYRLNKVFFNGKSFFEHVRNAYEEFPEVRYYGSYQFMKPSLFVRDLELMKKILVKDFEHFTDHVDILATDNDPIFSKNLFTMKGKDWRELRTTLSPAFTSAKMKAMFVLISETAEKFTRYFESSNQEVIELEMKETYSKFTNDVIATCAFGIKSDSLEEPDNEFFKMGQNVTRSTPYRMIRALLMMFFPKFFQLLQITVFPKEVGSFFKRIIIDTVSLREKKGIIRPDLIHLLMEAKKGKLSYEIQPTNVKETGFATVEEMRDDKTKSNLEINEDLMTAQAMIFFLAGFETSSTLLSFLSYELAKNPDVQTKLLKEIDENPSVTYENISKMKYLDQVVSEALRKWTPGFALARTCTKEYKIPATCEGEVDFVMPKGCFVMIPVVAIHYDPKYFENPEKFDPERFNDENKRKIVAGSYMPFGGGPRNCIGSRFALLEIKAVLVSILSKFEFEFVEKTPVPVKLKKTFGLLAEGGIWLGLRKRVK